jgi:uncharacterized protein (UPF0147 family)
MRRDIEQINGLMESIIADTTVPRNIRKAVQDAKTLVNGPEKSLSVNLTSAIYALDEALNDINLPFHTRPEIMSIISELERLKEQAK